MLNWIYIALDLDRHMAQNLILSSNSNWTFSEFCLLIYIYIYIYSTGGQKSNSSGSFKLKLVTTYT